MAEAVVPTPQQLAAITAPGGAAVYAGAGCGKTTVLAGRFLHLVQPPPDGEAPVKDVAQILAITFTEKAAAEMKGRIRLLVGRAVETAPDAERAHWERVRRELLGAQISTIHAFCARVLRDNPIEAGIDPHAVVLDEYESRDYVEAVIEAELLARLRAGDAAASALVTRTRGLRGRRGSGAVQVVARVLAELGRLGRDGTWLVAATEQATDARRLQEALAAAGGQLIGAVEAWLARAKRSAATAEVEADWPAWRERVAHLGPATTPAEFMELHALAVSLGRARGSGLGTFLGRKQDRLEGSLADAYGALAAGPESRLVAALLASVERALAAQKRADAVLTFDDLVRGAQAVLAAHPAVARRYASRFRAVLVDEFQDTDALQADLVSRIAGGPDTTLFVVGDEKQSIYRFRGAEIAVFKDVQDRIGRRYPLGRNFRSQPAVLGFVNALAAFMFEAPVDAAEPAQWTRFDATQRLEAERPQTRRTPSVRLVTFVEEFARRSVVASEARELEARVLAHVLRDLHERPVDAVGYGDVAVLFRTLNQVKAYEYALARRAIPYYVVKGRGFFQCQEVRDIVNMLGAVARPDDAIALAAVLRSPLFGIDDQTLWQLAWPPGRERPDLPRGFGDGTDAAVFGSAPALARARALLGELRQLRSRSAVAELLTRALAATDLEAVYLTQFQGRQKVANVRKVIELARDFDRRGQGGLAEFVRRLRALDAEDPREAEALLAGEHDQVVRLMTIHQAKGLEFPVVVLVDLGRGLDAENDTVVLDRADGLVMAPLVGPGGQSMRHAGLEVHRAREREAAQAEYARLLYVACTRAADELVLLEGRGKASYLREGKGDAHVWCHRLWDVIGREQVAVAASGSDPTLVTLGDGVVVSVEPAQRYLAAGSGVGPPPPDPIEASPTSETLAAVERVVGFAAPRPREVATTPTALAAFRRCPRQYWYRHVIGLDEGGSSGRRARLRGLLAHGVLEVVDYARPIDHDTLAWLAARRPESLQLGTAEVRDVVADLGAATALVGREVAAGLEVVAREEAVTLGLPFPHPEVMLHGRIDVLARRRGALVVQDYKYAEASPARVREYAEQLAVYRLAVERTYGTTVGGEIVFVRGVPQIVSLPALETSATEAALLDAGRALGAVLPRRDAAVFPRRPSGPEACRVLGCGFVRRCWRGSPGLSDSVPDGHRRTDGA